MDYICTCMVLTPMQVAKMDGSPGRSAYRHRLPVLLLGGTSHDKALGHGKRRRSQSILVYPTFLQVSIFYLLPDPLPNQRQLP